MHRGFKYRLAPTPEQAELLGQWVGVTRLVYNLGLEQRRDFWRQFRASEGRNISLASQGRELTALRQGFDWIAAVPQAALEAALNDLDRAYAAFFRGGGYPMPRRLGVNDSVRFRGRETSVRRLNAKWSEVKIAKLGWVRFRHTRDSVGKLLTATVARVRGVWTLVLTTDIGAAPPLNTMPGVGIDRGIKNAFSLSTGEHVSLPDTGRIEARKRRAQKTLARRKRGSRRYAAQRLRVAKLASLRAGIRAHHLHVVSKMIASRFGAVAIERLRVKNMTTSARGTIETPGRNVRQKAGLNRSILAQGWSLFATQLDYKLEAAGGRLVYVPAAFTSQTCADCGVVDARSRKSQAVFECVHCGHVAHADTNAARNIQRGSTAFVEEGRHFKPSVEARTLAA